MSQHSMFFTTIKSRIAKAWTDRSVESSVAVLWLTLLSFYSASLAVSRLMGAESANNPPVKVISKTVESMMSAKERDLASLVKLHPLPWQVNGQPLLGTYASGTDKLEELKKIHAVGMNLVLGDEGELDPTTAEGAYCLAHGIKVLHHLTNTIYHGVKLAEPISSEQKDIPLHFDNSLVKQTSHFVQIDDELICYERMMDTRLIGCQRGYGGTRPTVHQEGVILFWPQDCAIQIDRVKNSPNLFGYYVLDDSPGDAVSALRALYQTVQKADPGGRHPVCAGFGDAGSLVNLAPGVCDIMLIYWYPVSTKQYERERTSQEVQRMLTSARSRVPGIPFVGVYQAFDGSIAKTGQGVPTPEQLREQLEDFVREGASGLIAFISHAASLPGWADRPELERVIGQANREIIETGGLRVQPETESMRRDRLQPQGFWSEPKPLFGIVPAWYVLAPFPDTLHALLDARFPPDDSLDLNAIYSVKFGKAGWRRWKSTCGVLGITSLFGSHRMVQNCLAYALCEVTSPAEQAVQLRFCSDDDATIRLNGKEVYRFEGVRGLEYDKEVVPLLLPAGKSRFMIKVYNRAGMWGLYMRFTDPQGRPVKNLQFWP